ncbi:hypothetical protein ACQ4N7_03970 [Nodosilinea sp. AN01ver1]|uniref:hypothetical protein n=1 Tax=Nodosilinea sp. AN01ver1 TaxID=3423362 RepID=UPI003D31F500
MTSAIAEIIQNGLAFDVKNWGSAMEFGDLLATVESLFATLEDRQIEYLLVGGIAMLSYVEGRNTQDIDFIISKRALDDLSELVILEEDRDFVRGNFGPLQVDLLLTQNKLFKLINQRYAIKKTFGDRTIRCVTVEGLIILKLYALPSLYRQGNFDRASLYENDITQLMMNYPTELEPIFKILQPHLLASDIEAIRETANELKLRIQRFQAQQQRLDKLPDIES